MRESFPRRTGLEGMPKLVGMNKSKDPASLEDNEFANLVNVRVQGGKIKSRGGQGKVHDTGLPGCVEGIFSIDEEPSVCEGKMWFNSRDNLFSVTPGNPIVNEDPPWHPSIIIGHHAGELWVKSPGFFGGGSPGFRVSTITDDGATATDLFDTFPAGGAITNVYGETFRHSGGGNIYVPCGGAIVPAIIAWDGAVRTLDYDHGSGASFGPGPFFEIGADIFVFVGGRFYKRTGAGAWSIQAPVPSGWTAIGTHDGLLYGATQYNAGTGGYDIFTWDGSGALTLVHTIPVATVSTVAPFRIFSLDGKLYYLYAIPHATQASGQFILGCFDGTTWDDVIFTFTPTLAVGDNYNLAWTAASAGCVRGSVQVGTAPPPNVQAYVAASDGLNLAWFWKQTLYPNPQELYLHTDSGLRSKFFYFVD